MTINNENYYESALGKYEGNDSTISSAERNQIINLKGTLFLTFRKQQQIKLRY